jgi:hypothetical protein
MNNEAPKVHPYRVWWIPQIPLRNGTAPFVVETPTLEEAFRLEATLAQYDLYQLATKIKPDFSNTGGVERWLHDEQEWEEVDPDDEELEVDAVVNVDDWKSELEKCASI